LPLLKFQPSYLEVSNNKLHQDTFSTASVGDEMCRQIVTVNLL